MKKENKIY